MDASISMAIQFVFASAGWLPDGLPLLRVYAGRSGTGLTPAEMLDQIYRIQKLTGERVSNVVVMGSGEPLDNYDNLLVFFADADG